MKRIFDLLISVVLVIILLPLVFILAIWIKLDSRGKIIYRQKRVGLHGKDFEIFKFRTMYPNADKKGLLTVGGRDPRVTRIGYYLRKFKLDELPQLFNVINGDMSLVGPRPEVRKYVDMYNPEQKKVLNVKPGITDYASIYYRKENELLATAENPEQAYITEIMPHKLELNQQYINNAGVITDIKILWLTFSRVLFG
ncbi:MAG: sugar transferase [Bacteroidetes bacterium]|jgi:lipopolysaccharide/colanic/teichoic acid biosynthesis glycosyltransferase|nr:sugar transferase [Bacteroidota bacterium]